MVEVKSIWVQVRIFFNNSSSNNSETVSGMFLDSPATTSAVTYDVRVRVSGGSEHWFWAEIREQ